MIYLTQSLKCLRFNAQYAKQPNFAVEVLKIRMQINEQLGEIKQTSCSEGQL